MIGSARPQVERLSMRVALGATGLVALIYLGVAVVIVAWTTVSLTGQMDARLERTLASAVAGSRLAGQDQATEPPSGMVDRDRGRPDFGRERVTWLVMADGEVRSTRPDMTLPSDYAGATEPTTVESSGNEIRIVGMASEDGYFVVGESISPVNDARTTVILGLLAIAPFLLAGVFVGFLLVGRRVAMPIERARQRQLAFTADASHELRTPLSVIKANIELALSEAENGNSDRSRLELISDETDRMRAIIQDLLWLARFDAIREPPDEDPVNLGIVVEQAVDRFRPVAATKPLSLDLRVESPDVTLAVSPEWIDRLAGVLLDNACKYTPSGGQVGVKIERIGRRVVLGVDDSGPGIAPEEREKIFDRFRRASSQTEGTGLGLAIADAIVTATSGSWSIGTSPLGGARMQILWADTSRVDHE
jgi:signal transduction histidine kinase